MTITEIPSEDLEGQLLAIASMGKHMPPPDSTWDWMQDAIKELQLRRLARSSG